MAVPLWRVSENPAPDLLTGAPDAAVDIRFVKVEGLTQRILAENVSHDDMRALRDKKLGGLRSPIDDGRIKRASTDGVVDVGEFGGQLEKGLNDIDLVVFYRFKQLFAILRRLGVRALLRLIAI